MAFWGQAVPVTVAQPFLACCHPVNGPFHLLLFRGGGVPGKGWGRAPELQRLSSQGQRLHCLGFVTFSRASIGAGGLVFMMTSSPVGGSQPHQPLPTGCQCPWSYQVLSGHETGLTHLLMGLLAFAFSPCTFVGWPSQKENSHSLRSVCGRPPLGALR